MYCERTIILLRVVGMEDVSLFDKGSLKDRIFKKGKGIGTCPFLISLFIVFIQTEK